MPFIETPLKDLFVFEPNVLKDSRGYFFESYNQIEFEKNNFKFSFVQDNQSCSKYGVIRGLHYQVAPYAQTKLVRALRGKILDVVVDIRQNSSTFKKFFYLELSDENKKQLLIPRGFAHGFSVLSESAEVMYKCDHFYNKESERGIIFNDSILNIDWRIPATQQIVSDKDLKLPPFDNAELF